MARLPLAFLVLVPAFAACLAPAADDLAYRTTLDLVPPGAALAGAVVENLTLARPDGARLAMTVWRPDTDEKVPVLAAVSPYFNSDSRTWLLNAPNRRLAEYFLPHGYAIAQVALRGTGHSTGCFSVGGLDEQKDVAAIVDYLGELPWTNGKVGLIGKSYVGTTPWMAALEKPKHLGAIVPISGITDMYRYMFYNGTTLYPWGAHFLMYYGADEDIGVDPLAPLGLLGVTGANKERAILGTIGGLVEPEETMRSAPDHARCPTYPQLVANQYATDVHGTHDAFWDEREYSARFSEIEVPVFLIHGWQDWNVKPDHVARVWEKLDVPKIAWFGQWYHDYPDVNRLEPEWNRRDYNATLLGFFDATLKGRENRFFERPAVETQDQTGYWRAETTWPPADVVPRTLHLGDGALLDAPGAAGEARFVGDATRKPGPDAGPGSVAFVTEPLSEDLRVAGIPQVDLRLTPLQAGGHVAVLLYSVDAEGAWKRLDAGYLDLRHAGSRDEARPVRPGEPMAIRVEMFPQDLVFRAGERIGLVVAGENPPDARNGPFFWLEGWTNPGPIYPWVGPTAYVVDRDASALVLPVAPR